MFDSRKRAHPFCDSRRLRPRRTRRRHRPRGHFLRWRTCQREFPSRCRIASCLAFMTKNRMRFPVRTHPAAPRCFRLEPRYTCPLAPAASGGGSTDHPHSSTALRLPILILRRCALWRGYTLQRVMAPVQMVGREIQEHADVGAKRFNQLQLKTTQLHDSPPEI